MGMGTRKILKSEIKNSTNSQSAITNNAGELENLNSSLSGFIEETELQGEGWTSAKELASVYKTITQTFEMVSEQLSNANQKVLSSQGILVDDQIDEQALNNQVMQNKATMTQLSYANSIWNSANPGKPNQNSYNNLQHSIKNENNVLENRLDSLDKFDSTTKSVYDDLEHTLSNLTHLISQVSNSSKTYDSKTGLFITKNIDMKLVNKLNKEYGDTSESGIMKWLSSHTNLPASTIKNIAKGLRKNPANVMKEILNNEELVKALLFDAPEGIQIIFLKGFCSLEYLDKLPGKGANMVINSKIFINYAVSHPELADKLLDFTILLQKKGCSVLAPLKTLSDIAGKGTKAETILKWSLEMMKTGEKFKNAVKTIGKVVNLAVVANNFAHEYFDPTSEAYNDVDKATFGALCRYALESGPLEQGELFTIIGGSLVPEGGEFPGAALGITTGFVNWMGQQFGLIDKEQIMEKLYQAYDNINDPEKRDEILKDDFFWKQWKENPYNPENQKA